MHKEFSVIFLTISCLLCLGFAINPVHKHRPEKKRGKTDFAFLLKNNQVDKVILGQPIANIYKQYRASRIQKVLVYDEQGGYTKFEILNTDGKEVLFSVSPDCDESDSMCVVSVIDVKSKAFRTANNLNIGKYYIDLVRKKEKITFLNWFEGNLVVRVKNYGLNYVLETSEIPRPWFKTMNQETLPDSSRIIGISVTGNNINGHIFVDVDTLKFKRFKHLIDKKKSTPLASKELIPMKGYGKKVIPPVVQSQLVNLSFKVSSIVDTSYRVKAAWMSDTLQHEKAPEIKADSSGHKP